MDASKTQFLQRVKRDADGDVLISRATWGQVLSIALELSKAGQRIMLSPDGGQCEWAAPGARPSWTDCTDLSDEAFQRLVCERQSQPRIVSLAVAA